MKKHNVPRKLPYQLFLKSFEYSPRPAVNLLVVRIDGAILLTKRKKPPLAGSWHMPGSFLLKGEPLADCVHRVAKEELGVNVIDVELAGAFDDLTGDPRGHVVDVVYRCRIAQGRSFPALQGLALRNRKARPFEALNPVGDTAEMRLFKKLPENIGFNHRETLASLGYT